jgi:hypothetical protein
VTSLQPALDRALLGGLGFVVPLVTAYDPGSFGRLVPLTNMLTLRLPHFPHTSLSAQSGTEVSAPYRAAVSVGSGST